MTPVHSIPSGHVSFFCLLAPIFLACGEFNGHEDRADASMTAGSKQAEHGSLASLSDPIPVVVPGLDTSTAWFSRASRLRLDSASEHLFALDPFSNSVVELTGDGEFVEAYGGEQGRGPEEVSHIAGFAFDASHVVLLDAGNQKTLVYDRRGRFLRSLPSDHVYRHVMLRAGQLWLVPGGDSSLVDVQDLSGGPVRPLGHVEDLPIRCRDETSLESCLRLPSLCVGCRLENVNDTLFVIANVEESIINQYDGTGRLIGRKDFLKDDPIVRRWHEQDVSFLEEANASAAKQEGERTVMTKSYFLSFESLGGTLLAAAVAPSGPVVHEQGREYWVFDLGNGQIRRYRYPRRTLGYAAAGGGPVYAIDVDDGGIYKLNLPKDDSP